MAIVSGKPKTAYNNVFFSVGHECVIIKGEIILEGQQLKGRFVRTFGTHPNPFVNIYIYIFSINLLAFYH